MKLDDEIRWQFFFHFSIFFVIICYDRVLHDANSMKALK